MKVKNIFNLVVLIVLVTALVPPQSAARAAEVAYTVTSTDNLGENTLRWAINQANTHLGTGDVITINFDLEESDLNYDEGTGVWTITLDSALPILIANNTTIDGYSQTGAQYGTNSSLPTLVVELHSNLDPIEGPPTFADLFKSGLNIASANNTIRGLIINNFPVNGISIIGNTAISNSISGNYIGTNYDGTLDRGNVYDGVFIGYGAKNNLIGGDTPAERNVISGNDSVGVSIFNGSLDPPTTTTGNVISGNYIGTKADGTPYLRNVEHGVHIYGGAQSNIVGGSTAGTQNLIMGNGKDGIRIRGEGTDLNSILGNRILKNHDNGIQITFDAQINIIGGTTAGARNLISDNDESGIVITGTQTMSNTVLGNFIGTDLNGEGTAGNDHFGIAITGGASHNIIGGVSDQAGYNLISGNSRSGILLSDPGTSYNTIAGNYIGTDLTGTSAVGNEEYGIHIKGGASENMIGGDLESAFNLISGNENKGVFIYGPDAHANTIAGNYIGTDISGTEVISNTRGGVLINNGAYENIIGGDTPGEMNLISGNGGTGVFIELESHNNSIIGNTIGTDITGMEPLGNKFFGVAVSSSANTKIGGTSPGEGNLISGNGYSGINIENEESIDNLIAGNLIGTDRIGTKALPNTYGVFIGDGASGTIIGGTTDSAGNLISGNSIAGISISGEGTSGNTVIGNLLGTDISGLSILKNREGVYLTGGAQDNSIGGDTEAERNVISENRNSGITISGDNTTGNVILNNYIGVGVDGIEPLGNTSNGLNVSGSGNLIGPANIIAYNRLNGIYVHDEAALNNVITQNSIYRNGHGEYPGIQLYPGAHGDIQPPEITAANSSGEVSGTACANCTVELFWSQVGEGQGEVYLGSATANGAGNFNLSVSYPSAYNLTATATDARGTSEFSEVFNPLYLSYLPIAINGD